MERFRGFDVASALGFLLRSGKLPSQAYQGVFRFLLPVSTAEVLGRNRVPVPCLLFVLGLFLKGAEFPGDHRITGACIKLGELGRSVSAVFGFADSSLDLSPVGHVGAL